MQLLLILKGKTMSVTTMLVYVIFRALPDGELVGYHADSTGAITKERHEAKVYWSDNEQDLHKQLDIVRKNFEFAWSDEAADIGGGEAYRNLSLWKGHSIEQIKTLPEFLLAKEIYIRIFPKRQVASTIKE